jgi:GNAT superfamily N-acetyltransferase
MQSKKIRRALPQEAPWLTELSFASKAYWRYPQSYFRRWRHELTITADYIETHDVYVCDDGSYPCGYYSLVILQEALGVSGLVLAAGVWLEHMFVHPDNIGQGVGTLLFKHMCRLVEARGDNPIHLLADPHARQFYEKMGCEYQGDCPSTIPGRTTPYLICNVELHN